MINQNYIVRQNKGRSRIWIEGRRLIEAGFVSGSRFDLFNGSDGIELTLTEEGRRKVSGSNGRAIIDLCGAACEPFKTGENVGIHYSHGSIVIYFEGAQ